jgi:hypothetical protein
MADNGFLGGFANGYIEYLDQHIGDTTNRIVIPALFGGRVERYAIIDTGAPWCILDPLAARQLGMSERSAIVDTVLAVRGLRYAGFLHTVDIRVMATEGTDLLVDGVVFVPQLRPGEDWTLPNFLGLDGFLTRIRFAVDPLANRFYFGILSGDEIADQ